MSDRVFFHDAVKAFADLEKKGHGLDRQTGRRFKFFPVDDLLSKFRELLIEAGLSMRVDIEDCNLVRAGAFFSCVVKIKVEITRGSGNEMVIVQTHQWFGVGDGPASLAYSFALANAYKTFITRQFLVADFDPELFSPLPDVEVQQDNGRATDSQEVKMCTQRQSVYLAGLEIELIQAGKRLEIPKPFESMTYEQAQDYIREGQKLLDEGGSDGKKKAKRTS